MSNDSFECEEVGETLGIISGKWKPEIIYHLMTGGTKRFNELRRLIPTITQKMLTQKLRELEKQDIVERIVYPEVPPRVEYRMTEYGKSLQPIVEAMYEWGAAHMEKVKKASQEETRLTQTKTVQHKSKTG